MTYEDMQDALEDGWLPVAAVHAVEDHEGRVLYDEVLYGKYEIAADLEDVRATLDPEPPEDFIMAAVAAFGCKLRHRSHARRES
jgi:hypothetical protein